MKKLKSCDCITSRFQHDRFLAIRCNCTDYWPQNSWTKK